MAKFKSKKGNEEKVIKLIEDFLEKVFENEPDTIYYESLQEEDAVSFIHIMTFRNEEARKFHNSTNYFKIFEDHLYPSLEVKPTLSRYNIVKSLRKY